MPSIFKIPAQVTIAAPAEGKTPDITGKPGKLRSCFPGPVTAGSSAEAAQLKNYPRRIKEGMGMGALYGNFPVPVRYCRTTYSAKNSIKGKGLFPLIFLADGQFGLTRPVAALPGVNPKAKAGVTFHLPGNNPQ